MTQINPAIFRAYDIRGLAETSSPELKPDLTPKTAKLIGLATGTYLIRTYKTKSIIVGRDVRIHSEDLQNAVMEGLALSGLEVKNAGLTTSPMIYFAVCHFNFDAGINITASHNPKEYNGVKIVREMATSVADQELQSILKLIQTNDFEKAKQPKHIQTSPDIFSEYLKFIVHNTKLARPLNIAVDAGNGVAGPYIAQLLRAIGCQVTELHCEPDGNFPNHEANPEDANNLLELSKLVKEKNLDLGLGFDGDGDRIGIIDETGKHYPAEYLIMLLSRDLLKSHPNEKIIFDVKVSNNLIKDIKNHGGTPIMSKTGHSFIEQKVHELNAALAGENSGHLFFGEKHYNYFGFDDAMFAACKILEILSNSNLKFSEHFTDLPKLLSTPEIKIPCPDSIKFQIIEKIKQHFTQNYDCITLDGVRVNFSEISWGAIRASNTTPCLTFRCEAGNQADLEQIQQLFFNELKKYPEVNLPTNN